MVGRCLRVRLGKLSDLGLVGVVSVVAIKAKPCVEGTIAWAAVEFSAVDFVEMDVGVLVGVESTRVAERSVADGTIVPLRGDIVCCPVFEVKVLERLLDAVQLVFVRLSSLVIIESSNSFEVEAARNARVFASGLRLQRTLRMGNLLRSLAALFVVLASLGLPPGEVPKLELVVSGGADELRLQFLPTVQFFLFPSDLPNSETVFLAIETLDE